MIRNSFIISPLKSEFSFLTDAFIAGGLKASDEMHGAIQIRRFPQLNLICAIGGHGKVQFGIQTQYLIHHFPGMQRIFCAGAAGGLARVKTFDVVVAERTVEHDYTERFDPAPPPYFDGCKSSIEKMKVKIAAATFSFNTHFGLIASGDEDIVTNERAFELHEKTNALAVAWEGAGGARACAFNDKPYVEIRGITDVADNNAAIDFRENLRAAMKNVSAVLMAMDG